MNRPKSPLRRRFLKTALAAASGSAVSCSRRKGAWRFFTDEQARLVAAVADQIIPPDQDPGASAAGVVDYIDGQLVRRFKANQDDYRKGLSAIEETARRHGGKGFLELGPSEQEALLAEFEKGPQRAFFDLIWNHTMQGYYGSPRHGGNRDAVSWKMIGVPDPPVRGRQHHDFPAKV